MTQDSPDRSDVVTRVAAKLRDIPDFPKPGVNFKDITPVLGDAELFRDVIAAMAAPWMPEGITHVAGIESRGFILAAPIGVALNAGFIPIRKPGKLPFQTHAAEYKLEYGTDRLEIHVDACPGPSRVLLVDDVLATGGTAHAAAQLIERAGGRVIGCAFMIAIGQLNGQVKLSGRRVAALTRI